MKKRYLSVQVSQDLKKKDSASGRVAVSRENGAPCMFVEVKTGDDDIAKGLKYLAARFPKTQAWQISLSGTKDYISQEKIHVTPAITLLKELV